MAINSIEQYMDFMGWKSEWKFLNTAEVESLGDLTKIPNYINNTYKASDKDAVNLGGKKAMVVKKDWLEKETSFFANVTPVEQPVETPKASIPPPPPPLEKTVVDTSGVPEDIKQVAEASDNIHIVTMPKQEEQAPEIKSTEWEPHVHNRVKVLLSLKFEVDDDDKELLHAPDQEMISYEDIDTMENAEWTSFVNVYKSAPVTNKSEEIKKAVDDMVETSEKEVEAEVAAEKSDLDLARERVKARIKQDTDDAKERIAERNKAKEDPQANMVARRTDILINSLEMKLEGDNVIGKNDYNKDFNFHVNEISTMEEDMFHNSVEKLKEELSKRKVELSKNEQAAHEELENEELSGKTTDEAVVDNTKARRQALYALGWKEHERYAKYLTSPKGGGLTYDEILDMSEAEFKKLLAIPVEKPGDLPNDKDAGFDQKEAELGVSSNMQPVIDIKEFDKEEEIRKANKVDILTGENKAENFGKNFKAGKEAAIKDGIWPKDNSRDDIAFAVMLKMVSPTSKKGADTIAKFAYELADAMLNQKDK